MDSTPRIAMACIKGSVCVTAFIIASLKVNAAIEMHIAMMPRELSDRAKLRSAGLRLWAYLPPGHTARLGGPSTFACETETPPPSLAAGHPAAKTLRSEIAAFDRIH